MPLGLRELCRGQCKQAPRRLNIEHIMLQTLNDEWRDYLGERYEIIHQLYLNTIENLTLTAYNFEYGSLPFLEKRDFPDYGFASSILYLNLYEKSQNELKEEQIVERANILCDRALRIWPYPLQEKTEVLDFDIHNFNTLGDVKIT